MARIDDIDWRSMPEGHATAILRFRLWSIVREALRQRPPKFIYCVGCQMRILHKCAPHPIQDWYPPWQCLNCRHWNKER